MNNIPEKYPLKMISDTRRHVSYIHQGEGEPVILIHGLAASVFDWKDLIPELSRAGYSCYALDLLGHGNSDKPKNINDYVMNNVFDDFNDWISSLNLKHAAVIIGHSLGAHVAIQYTLQNPDKVSALILCDPFYSLSQLPMILRLNYQYSIISTTLIDHTPMWLIEKIVDLTSLSIRNGYELPESVRKQTALDYKRAQPGIFNIIHTIRDLSPRLSAIYQPTLVLWGTNDRTLAPGTFEKLLVDIPHSRGVQIKGAGHVPHQSHPEIFNQYVLDFLQKSNFQGS